MRINQYTESDKCENKAGKSASLTLTQFRVNLLYRSSIAWLTTKTLIASPLKKQSTLLFASAVCEGPENGGWKQARGSKRAMLLSVVGACLSVTLLSASEAKAETCTASPDCKSLGYTESSCSDGGVKCPWNPNLLFCCKKCAPSCEVKICQIGDVLYSDKKCYTCPNVYTLPGIPPIGVVFSSGKAVALSDLSGTMNWSNARSSCSSYSVGGVSGWYLPSKDELLTMYNNINAVQTGLQSAVGGSKLASGYYWSSSYHHTNSDGSKGYWVVYPVSGDTTNFRETNGHYVRPVLAL